MINFHKFEGLGNDFLIVRESELAGIAEPREPFYARLCDRHFGAGADGVEVLQSGAVTGADFAIRLFNADGGETPISGNGTRCVAAWLYLVEGWDAPSVRIATGAGIRELFPVGPIDRSSGRMVFRAAMGYPRLSSIEIPINLSSSLERVVDQPLDLSGETVRITATSMGNPHCSIFVDDFEAIDWRRLGAEIETDPRFPERTNVEFIRLIDSETIEVRFWERGCGETLASGTGSCGAALAAILNGHTGRRVTVRTVAGELVVEWLEDGSVWQTGEARAVYSASLFDRP
jgi:diaminopimelate epimerase